MFLKPENYTYTRALDYSICFDHLKETQVGSLGHRIVHFIIGAVELIPIVGQIASLFETAVASVMLTSSTPPNPASSLNGESERSQSPIQIKLDNKKMPLQVKHEDREETPFTLAQRNRAAFLAYQQSQQAAGGLVDLIVGRGRTECPNKYPILVEERYDSIREERCIYNPLTLDLSKIENPDCEANFSLLKQMEFIPDSSVDEIYLERLHPPILSKKPEIGQFINAARILKEGGSLRADFNDSESIEEHKRRINTLNTFFNKYSIPLTAELASNKGNNRRNDICFYDTLVCTKYTEYTPRQILLDKPPALWSFEFNEMLSSSNL